MSMHRRWLFTTTGQAILATLAGSALASESDKPKGDLGPPTCPTPSSAPVTRFPGSVGEAEKELRDCFYEGTDIAVLGSGKFWGLNGPKTPKEDQLDVDRKILPAHLGGHYTDRLTYHFNAHNAELKARYALLKEQAALLGALTRCMRDTYSQGKPVEAKHLNWAREALGFALNAKLQGCLQRQCNMWIPSLQNKSPQLDQPCPLC